MNATEYAKSFLAICAAIGLFCSIVGSGFWGVTNVLAQIASIEETQQKQSQNKQAIDEVKEQVKALDSKMDTNQEALINLIRERLPPSHSD